MASGSLIVISAPSGAGKTSLTRAVIQQMENLGYHASFSISYTTREPRPGEQDGVDYHFITPDEFERMIEDMEKQLFNDQEGGASELKIKSDEVEIAAVKMQAMWRGANVRSNLLKQLEELEENY